MILTGSSTLNRLGLTSELAGARLNRVGSSQLLNTLNRLGLTSELAGARLNRVWHAVWVILASHVNTAQSGDPHGLVNPQSARPQSGGRYWDWFGDGSLAVTDLGLACCILEFDAATSGRAWTTEPPPDARIAVVVAGTLTTAAAPLVVRAIAAQPRTPLVVAFGACACNGGPYWDSPHVVQGVDQLVPVDSFVPGCPPQPQALTAALAGLVGGEAVSR